MDCPSCAGKVENSVKRLDGINDLNPQATTGTLTVSYDHERTSATAIAERVEKAGYTVEDESETSIKLPVPEMDCASCAGKIENALKKTGVTTYETRPTTGTVVVTFESSRVKEADVIKAIESAGYGVTETRTDKSGDDNAGGERESIWTSSRA
ncbi:copper ion binding protein, partial [Halorubrum ezzemoulense]